MLRKTSSGRVLRGIVILLLAMWLSPPDPLTATSFLLNRVVEWGILVLVILFQPELRRLLERVGSSRFGLVFRLQPATAHGRAGDRHHSRPPRPTPTCPGTRWAP